MPFRKQQAEKGATAIEFSIVFALLFGMFWAIISYALPFFLYQAMNHATAESARYAMRLNPELADSAIETYVDNYLWNNALSVLPDGYIDILKSHNPSPSDMTIDAISAISYRTIKVTLTYPGCSVSQQAGCLVPALNLAGMSIPNLRPFTVVTTVHLEREDR